MAESNLFSLLTSLTLTPQFVLILNIMFFNCAVVYFSLSTVPPSPPWPTRKTVGIVVFGHGPALERPGLPESWTYSMGGC
jgi:hypothetical protein